MNAVTSAIFIVIIGVSSIPLLIIPIVTLVLALITTLCNFKIISSYRTSLYSGRVSHARFKPVVHSFSYPLFFCLLDLDEIDKLFGKQCLDKEDKSEKRSRPALYPLNILMSFRETDHLKNGEGLLPNNDGKQQTDGKFEDKLDKSLKSRICRLISERTDGKYIPLSNQTVFLLTHLSYFGYCFNPVSFYYIMAKDFDKEVNGEMFQSDCIEAIVAEVSNTPWNEMKCYVLHPDSRDMDLVQEGRAKKHQHLTCWKLNPSLVSDINDFDEGHVNNGWKSTNYIFKKKFHVSPFMDMEHTYDWTFWDLTPNRIAVSTNMIKKKLISSDGPVSEHSVKKFNAYFDIHKKAFTPFVLATQLIQFPMYCLIIQIWIHIEAAKLFMKGVEFIPHPKGSESEASRIIGKLMVPFFALKKYVNMKDGEHKLHEKIE